MSNEIDSRRRRILGTVAVGIGAIGAGASRWGRAQSADVAAGGSIATSAASFARIRQINAGVLNVGYAELGPANGPVVVLLHGWPYDIHSFAEVASRLASAGYRVIVPYLRGYGTTRFLSRGTVRNGQQSVLAVDVIALMDALKIQTAIFAGFDWGAHSRRRCRALAGTLQGFGVGERLSDRQPDRQRGPLAAEGRTCMVVSVLLRYGARR